MSTTSALMTVEEFRKLKDPPGFYLELHHGEVVQLTRAKLKHWKIQTRVTDMFHRINRKYGISGYEFAFRPRHELELWCADVAFIAKERFNAADDDDNLIGSPDIVVEVLSPSNRKSEIVEKQTMCLATGSQQFWVIDPKRKTVEITGPDGRSMVYRLGQSILVLPGKRKIKVDEIFG